MPIDRFGALYLASEKTMGTKDFNKEDLKEAFDAHFDGLRNFLYYKCGDVELAADIAQEAFLKIWEKRTEVRKETVKNLLFTIGNNQLMNHFNHMKVVSNHEQAFSQDQKADQQSPQFKVEEKEFEQQLNTVMKSLPEGSREVFLMNRIDGLKYDEISEQLGIGVKAVEKRMSKALAIIRDTLGRKI